MNLTGTMPVIPPTVEDTYFAFSNCYNLTDIRNPSAPDSEIMPSSVTRPNYCVNNCNDTLRSRFLTTWGGSRAE